jgi:UDP-N-acetylmuramyl pentapeptide phosphotransferase/UDP-N-acetylglucosamine-1-phosphate transferase
MKLWYVSLILSIVSCIILLVICLLPDGYTIFIWTRPQIEAGVLFPVLLISWTTAILGFLFNNLFIDKNLVDKRAKTMHPLKAYIPTYLGFPAFFSFLWFVIRWYKGKPNI